MKKITFKSAETVGYFEVPDDAVLTIPEGIQANAEEIEPLMSNAEVTEEVADEITTEIMDLQDGGDGVAPMLPTEADFHAKRKVDPDTTGGEDVEPLMP